MSFWRRLALAALVMFVVMVAVLPVLAQGQGADDVLANEGMLADEVGSFLLRSWCREQARIAAIDLNAEVGCALWRCWCRDHPA